MRRNSMKWRMGMAMVVALAAVALTGDARADRLDFQLNKQMPEIVKELKAKYSNVGVLRFRVQDGTARESFTAPLCGNLVDRVETLLIVNNGDDESRALGIIHDAGKAASKQKIGQWFSKMADRRKLFDVNYPLAWGTERVKADAFLTGKVTVSKDGKTTLVLECFDKTNLSLRTLATMSIDTDRFVLRDLGYSLSATSRGKSLLTAKRSSIAEQDKRVYRLMPKRRKPDENTTPNGVDQVKPDNIGGGSLKVLVDGKEESDLIREAATEGDGAKWQMKSPSEKAKIVFWLQNNSDKKRAVVLRLNERNVINEQSDDPEMSAKFVLMPKGEKYSEVKVKGFIKLPEDSEDGSGKVGETKVLPFKVLVGKGAEEAKEQMGARAGWIEVVVFEEGETDLDVMLIAPRGLPPSKEKQARSTYLGLRSALLRSSKLKTETKVVMVDGLAVKKELIVADEAAMEKAGGVKFVTFKAKHLQTLKFRIVPGEDTPPGGGGADGE